MKNLTKGMLMTALITGMLGCAAAYAAEATQEFDLDPMIVTATRSEKKDVEVAASTEVITSDRIADMGTQNAQQILQAAAGLVYDSKGPGGASLGTMTSKVAIRGVEKGTLVLVDGTPMNYRGLYNLEDIPSDIIEKIEIVRGGGAVLYGSNATGGVVNIITKAKLQNSVKVGFGKDKRQNHAVNVQADKVTVSYAYDKWGETGIVSKSTTVLDAPGSKAMNNRFRGSEKNNFMAKYKFSDFVDFSYRHGRADSKFAYAFGDYYKPELIGKDRYNRKYTKTENAYQLNMKDGKGLKGNIHWVRNDWRTAGTDFLSSTGSTKGYPKPKNSKEKNFNYGLDVSKNWNTKANNYLLGFTYDREEFQDADLNVWTDKRSRNNFSLYGSWETGIGSKDLFTLSGRESWTTGADEDKNFHNFSGQAQYLRKLSDTQSVYASIGQSFTMPTFANMYATGSALTVGDSGLKPEKGMHYEVGYKNETEKHQYKAAFFVTKIKDQITYSKGKYNGNDAYYAINEDFKNLGIELTATTKLGNGFTYNYGVVIQDPQCKSNTDKDGVITDWRPKFGRLQLNGGLTYRNNKFTTNLTGSYLANRVMTSNTKGDARTKPYFLTTFNAKYAPDKHNEFSLNMDNILDRRDNVSHTSSYYYGTPFSFMVNYAYKF